VDERVEESNEASGCGRLDSAVRDMRRKANHGDLKSRGKSMNVSHLDASTKAYLPDNRPLCMT